MYINLIPTEHEEDEIDNDYDYVEEVQQADQRKIEHTSRKCDKNFVCNVCDKYFLRKSDVMKHKKKEHREQVAIYVGVTPKGCAYLAMNIVGLTTWKQYKISLELIVISAIKILKPGVTFLNIRRKNINNLSLHVEMMKMETVFTMNIDGLFIKMIIRKKMKKKTIVKKYLTKSLE